MLFCLSFFSFLLQNLTVKASHEINHAPAQTSYFIYLEKMIVLHLSQDLFLIFPSYPIYQNILHSLNLVLLCPCSLPVPLHKQLQSWRRGGHSDFTGQSKKSFLDSADVNTGSKTFLQRMGIPPPKFQKLRATVDENLLKLKCLVCASFNHLIVLGKHSEERHVSCSLFPEHTVVVPEMIFGLQNHQMNVSMGSFIYRWCLAQEFTTVNRDLMPQE